MLRKFGVAVLALVIGVAVLFAAEIKGKVKKYEKGTLVITADGKDHEFKVGKDAKVTKAGSEVKGKRSEVLKEGTEVTIIYDKEGDKTTVKEVKIK
ncbi:MAG TPA: hypothetical protein VNK04_14715 [Gemmataceae bacterium]|nr:hypothetical protein [Gemmataceae bacterium]